MRRLILPMLLTSLLCVPLVQAQEKRVEMDEATKKATAKALEWLKDRANSDVSVTIMQVMALRAAKNAGLHVPDTTLKKALAYIKSCYRPTTGGFTYMPGSGAPGFARTAAGLCVLFLTGEYEAKEIPKGVEY